MSKKDRKRRSMIAVILLIAFLIAGCEDKSVKTDHIIRIGVVTYTQDDPVINAMTDQLKENLKKMETEHMKIITTVKNGDDNQQDQNEIVEEMIDAGCDVLCVNLVDRTAPSRIIRMAKQEDIPVLFFNREPVREDLMQWEKLYYIGCNAEQSGIMQGEIVADILRIIRKLIRIRMGRFSIYFWKERPDIRMPSAEQTIRLRPCLNRGLILKN